MYTVLYIDDEPALLDLGKEFLENAGEFTVETSLSAEDALERLQDRTYDCIVSDFQMPGKDGIAFLKEVRQGFGDLPFILFTGRGREEIVIEAINNGADFYLQKGGDPSAQFAELAHKIRQAVARRRAESSRQHAEHSLKESEEKYRNILERLQDAYFRTDETGTIIMVNPAAARMYGYGSPEEMTGLPATMFYNGGPEERSEMLRQLKEASSIVNFIGRGRRKDGTTFATSMNAQFIRDRDGRVRGTEATVRDVSERQNAEDELRAAFEQITASEEELRNNLDEIVREHQEREKSERNFQYVVENAPDAIYIEVNERFLFLNRAAVRLFGAESAGQLEGSVVWDRIHPAFHTIVRERVRKLTIENEPVSSLDEVCVRLDGTTVDVEVTAVPYQSAGKPGTLVMLRDISGRKKAEDALRVSEEMYRTLVEKANEAITIIQDGRMVFANPMMAELVGVTVDKLTRMNFLDVAWPEDRDLLLDRHRQRIAGEPVPERYDFRMIGPEGTARWVHLSVARIQWKGRPATLNMMADITERMQAEEQVRNSGIRFSTIFRNNPVSLTLVSAVDSTFSDVNDAFLKNTGYSREEVIGRRSNDLGLFADPAELERFTKQLQEERLVRGMEARLRRKDGSVHVCLFSASIILLDNRPHILSSVEDITEKSRADEALRKANRRLNLLSGITRHDIRNQLLMLDGYVALLKKQNTDPGAARHFSRIEAASSRISGMIEFTRDYEKIGIHAPVWHEIRSLADSAGRDAGQGKVRIVNDLPSGAEVLADPLITKVFFNLIDNALRHGEKVTTIRFSLASADGHAVMVCEDDGTGIRAEDKMKIFERGFGKNTGFGLALSREILEITGILINENGTPGAGARFEMVVPAGDFRTAKNAGTTAPAGG